MLGMHGTRTANYAMDEADLICCVGARFDDRITGKLSEFAPRAKFIHIDVDPAEISKNVPAHIPIVGDAKGILAKLKVEYEALEADPARLATGGSASSSWQAKHPLAYDGLRRRGDQAAAADRGGLRGDRRRGDHRHRRRPAPDVGRAVLPLQAARASGSPPAGSGRWASACRPRMGAAIGCPDETVVCITGRRLDPDERPGVRRPARRRAIPVKVIIANNGYLGMVRQWQELFWEKRYSSVDMGQYPDFVKLAEAYGCTGMRLTNKGTLVDDIARRDRDAGPGRRRRPRHPRGERVPDDRRPARPRATWWGEAWVSPESRKCCRSRTSRPPAR